MANNPQAGSSRRVFLATGYSALIIGFTIFAVVPYVRGMASARTAIAASQKEIEARSDRARQLDQVEHSLKLIDIQTRNFDRLVPTNEDQGPFLTELSEQLKKVDMRDVSLSALQPTPLGKSQRKPIEVRARGTFAQLHDFLVRLEHLQRLSSVGKLSIEADNDMKGNVTAQMTLYIYYTKSSS